MNAPVPTKAFTPDPRDLHDVAYADIAHIPGFKPQRFPILRTLKFLKDPLAGVTSNVAEYGPVYRVDNFGGWNVVMTGADANEMLLFDRDKNFSSKLGWDPILDRLFPRGLMLMDFDHHRADRKALSVAFKPEPMKNYLDALNDGIARGVADWHTRGEFKFYPAIKALTLDLAATSFLGIPWGPEASAINQAFVDMVAASIGIIRVPLPGTAMGRGVKGRKFMCAFFAREIPGRRGKTGDDFFTQFCNVTDEDGKLLADQQIIDHMNFLMMAAHDTLTSTLSSTIYYLARNPEWQDRVRAEINALRATAGPMLPYERLGELEQLEWAFKESMRLLPPVPSLPRRALRDFEYGGYRIPAGAHVSISPMYVHRMAEYWEEPETWDPSRFSHNRSKGRHKYAWVPFGGGAHMCVGMHFAYMQMKSFFYTLLADHRVTLRKGYEPDIQMFPIPKPRDGLPIRIERI
jgi:cytochrome P450